jgi:hypothetical protein
VADEHKQDAVASPASGDKIRDVLRNLEEPLPARLDRERCGGDEVGRERRNRSETVHGVVPAEDLFLEISIEYSGMTAAPWLPDKRQCFSMEIVTLVMGIPDY